MNKASQALVNAAKEVERLEVALESSARSLAFLLLNKKSIKTDYLASPAFVKAVKDGDLKIIMIMNPNPKIHEFTLGIRDGNTYRSLTNIERNSFIIKQ